MTQTTRRLRESSVLIVASHIPDGMTIADYRRAQSRREAAAPRRRLPWGSKVRSSSTV